LTTRTDGQLADSSSCSCSCEAQLEAVGIVTKAIDYVYAESNLAVVGNVMGVPAAGFVQKIGYPTRLLPA